MWPKQMQIMSSAKFLGLSGVNLLVLPQTNHTWFYCKWPHTVQRILLSNKSTFSTVDVILCGQLER